MELAPEGPWKCPDQEQLQIHQTNQTALLWPKGQERCMKKSKGTNFHNLTCHLKQVTKFKLTSDGQHTAKLVLFFQF